MNRQAAFEVSDTPELQRILHLPRRVWEGAVVENDLYLRMTTAFRTPNGKQVLRLPQAAALMDLHDLRGLIAPMPVGVGKTHVTYLAPLVLDAKRPLLLLPGGLIEKTWREFSKLLLHWIAHPAWLSRKAFDHHVLSYNKLSRDQYKDVLFDRRPDLIIADEAHKLKSLDAGCTKRLQRYMIANPDTMFAAMSGTFTKRSILDYWHLSYYALKNAVPLPRTRAEAERWAEAIDERKSEAISRRGPGALLQFCTPLELQELSKPANTNSNAPITSQMAQTIDLHDRRLTAARIAYQRRFTQTPGVVMVHSADVEASLQIQRLDWDPGDAVRQHLIRLREEKETPNGVSVAMPVDIWRHARELACGFYYLWDPPAPNEWRSARKTWHWWLREILLPGGKFHYLAQRHQLDTPLQVVNNIRNGKLKHEHAQKALEHWSAIEPTFKPKTRPEWISDDIIQQTVEWAHKHKHGIIWTEHKAFGRAVARALGTGFCSDGGRDDKGRLIDDYNGKLVVASVSANKEGRNLQAWHRNLVVTVPPNGLTMEQLIGRTHRPYQEADTVYVDWVNAVEEQYDGFQQILLDAKYIEQSQGQKQKVLYADHVR